MTLFSNKTFLQIHCPLSAGSDHWHVLQFTAGAALKWQILLYEQKEHLYQLGLFDIFGGGDGESIIFFDKSQYLE